MRQPVQLVGPGVTADEIAAYFGITPERQAEIRELFRSYHEKHARKNGPRTNRASKKAASKKSAPRK
jgi:predicted Fe-S protein YdhL (DUF1289 family)